MASKDPVNPRANLWLRSEQGRPSETTARGRGQRALQTGHLALSAPLLRLAKRLGRTPEELAERISPDTLRRLKYPVVEILEADGTRTYKHDQQVSEGVLSLPQTHK